MLFVLNMGRHLFTLLSLRRLIERRLIAAYPVSAAPFGCVQCRIGGRDQRVRTVSMQRPGRDSDADGNAHRRARVDVKRLRFHAGAQALGDVGGGVGISLRQDDGNLFAAVAAYAVDGTRLPGQQLAQPLENGVPA